MVQCTAEPWYKLLPVPFMFSRCFMIIFTEHTIGAWEHFPQLGSILQWGPQFDQFPPFFVHLSTFVLLHHLLPLSLHLLFSLHLPLPSPAPHQSLFCSTISKSAVLSLSSSGLSPHFHLSALVIPCGGHLKWCFIATFNRRTFPTAASNPLSQQRSTI